MVGEEGRGTQETEVETHIVQLSHLCYLDLKIGIFDTQIHNKQSGTVDSALGS